MSIYGIWGKTHWTRTRRNFEAGLIFDITEMREILLYAPTVASKLGFRVFLSSKYAARRDCTGFSFRLDLVHANACTLTFEKCERQHLSGPNVLNFL